MAERSSLALAFLFPCMVFAQQVPSQTSTVPTSLTLGGAFQVLLGLSIVLAAIAGAVWLLKRFPVGQQAMGGAVRVIGGVALGPRERLVLVEIGETWLLLGVAPGQVNALHSLPKPSDACQIEVLPESAFAVWLKRALQGRVDK